MRERKSKGLKSQKAKQRIMDSYLTAMQGKSWDKITVRELCAGLDISRATFY